MKGRPTIPVDAFRTTNRYGRRIFEKCSQEPRCRELQRVPQAIAVTSLAGDPFAIIIVKMETTRQFVGRQRVGVTAVALSLRGSQEADGHGASECFSAERGRSDDPCVPNVPTLQQSRTVVSGH